MFGGTLSKWLIFSLKVFDNAFVNKFSVFCGFFFDEYKCFRREESNGVSWGNPSAVKNGNSTSLIKFLHLQSWNPVNIADSLMLESRPNFDANSSFLCEKEINLFTNKEWELL